jgi:hypothetical protein
MQGRPDKMLRKNVTEHGGAYWLLDVIAIGAIGIDADDIADRPPEM